MKLLSMNVFREIFYTYWNDGFSGVFRIHALKNWNEEGKWFPG